MLIPIHTKSADGTTYVDRIAVKDLHDSGIDLKTWVELGVVSKEQINAVEKQWAGWSNLNDNAGGGMTNSRRPVTDWSLLAEYANNPIVFTCVDMNATAISSTDWVVCSLAEASKATTKRKRIKKSIRKRAAVVLKSDESEIVDLTDHPLYDILNKDNEDINGSQLLKLTQGYLEVLGRAYWYLDDDDYGNKRITILKPQSVIPLRDVSGYVVGYNYYNYVEGFVVSGTDSAGADLTKVIRLDKSQVIDFRFAPLTDPYAGGLSPLRAAMRAVFQSSQYTDWLNNVLSNRQRMDWILIPKTPEGQTLSKDEKDRLYKDVEQRLAGRNNGKPLILESSMTAVPMSFAPTDLAGLEINAEVQKLTCNAFGIPPALMDKDANYANMEASLELWARRAIAPRIALIEQTINENLAKLGIEDEVFIVFDNPVPEDEQFELAQATANAQILQIAAAASVPMTDNEKRAMVGLEPLDDPSADEIPQDEPAPVSVAPLPSVEDDGAGGPDQDDPNTGDSLNDELPSDDNDGLLSNDAKGFDRLLTLNAFVAEGKLPRSVAISLAERLGYGTNAKQLVGFGPSQGSTAPQCSCRSPKCGTKASRGIPKAGAATPNEKIIGRLKKAVAGWFDDLRKSALATIKKSASEGIITKADTGNLPHIFVDVDDWANNLRGTEDDLAYRVKPLLEMQAQEIADGKAEYYGQLGASPDAFDVVPHEVAAATDKRAYKFAQSTLDTTQKSVAEVVDGVRELVRDGVLEGDSNDALAEKIGEFFENASDYQAERIARTEASAAVHTGQVITAKASGIVKGFRYEVSEEACDVCQPYSDTEVDINDYDDSGEVDAEGAVPLHPYCTCTLLEVIDTDAMTDEGEDDESK